VSLTIGSRTTRVDVSLPRDADLDASTGDGAIEAEGLRGDLTLTTGDGSLKVDLPVEVCGRMQRHTVFGRMNGGGPLLRMRSSDGSIRLERL
jgi:hypothetical protein